MGADLGHRKSKRRHCAKKILILVEGMSEDTYFRYFKGRSPDLKIIPVEVKRSGLDQILKECQYRIRDYKIEGVEDKVAAVFDVDCFTGEEIEPSIYMASEHGIDLYVSNPSFEYWLILHFREYNKHASQKDMEDELSALLEKKYIKSEGITSVINDQIISGAIVRASKTIPLGNIDPMFCKNHPPSTTVHSLVREIMDIIQNKGPQ